MKIDTYQFGSVTIDGKAYTKDIVIHNTSIEKRKKKKSKQYKSQYGHTPLSVEENIPWECKKLVIGTGIHGKLPVMDEVKQEANRRGVDLIIRTTPEALDYLNEPETNLILHLTC